MKKLWTVMMLSMVVSGASLTAIRAQDATTSKKDELPIITPAQREPLAEDRSTEPTPPVPPAVNNKDIVGDLQAQADPPRRPEGDRGPRPEARRDGDQGGRRPEAGPPREGRPGERPPEARRPDGDRGPRPDGDRGPHPEMTHGPRPDGGPRPSFAGPAGRPGFGPLARPQGSSQFGGRPPFAGGPFSSGHLPFDQVDTNRDGKMTREEVLRHFDRTDKNHDGAVTRDEVMATIHDQRPSGDRDSRGPRDGDRPQGSAAGRPIDARPRGDAPKDAAPMHRVPPTGRPGADAGRDRANLDRSGLPSPQAMFERGDRNKDGKVTKDEVPSFAWERLSKLDRNNDGGVSKDELLQGLRDRGRPEGRRPDETKGRRPERPNQRREEASA